MRKSKLMGTILLLTLLASASGMLNIAPLSSAAETAYSPALIGELGEASTVLIFSIIDATIKVPVPDENMAPTAEYISVPVSTTIMGSGSFVSSTGYILTAGHVVYAFTHADITQDLYTKYYLIDTAFLVLLDALEEEGYVFTAAEQAVLEDYIQTYGSLIDSLRSVYAALGEVKPTLTSIQAKGWSARVVNVSPYVERDLALLKIEGLANCPILVVGDSDKVVTGDDVYMFGFPGVVTLHVELGPETTLAPSMTGGIISAKRYTTSQTPCFQTDAAITHGNSGGAGLDENGQIIGVCSRGALTETGQQVAGFDFLIQGSVVKSFLAESNVDNSKGVVDDAFLRGLTNYYDKHYSEAKKEFETAAGLFEYHWRAKALISECVAGIARGDDVPLTVPMDSTTIIIIGVVVAVVVCIAAFALVRRRRASRAPPGIPPPPPPARSQ